LSLPKLVVHTDVVVDYLLHHEPNPPLLRLLMMKFFCYTTVFNAIELFALARNARERKAVEDSLSAMKILGLNAKQAKRFGELFRRNASPAVLDTLVAGICIESRLPLITGKRGDYKGLKELRLIRSGSVQASMSAKQIMALARPPG
jgi:predicted nucleic acid-binding protein